MDGILVSKDCIIMAIQGTIGDAEEEEDLRDLELEAFINFFKV